MVLDLKIDVKNEENIPIIDLNGEIDIYTYPKLSKVLDKVIGEGSNSMILNLEKVSYMDSTGLGAIAAGVNKLSQSGGYMNIICTKPQVKKIFKVSGLINKNLSIFDEKNEALAKAKKDTKQGVKS